MCTVSLLKVIFAVSAYVYVYTYIHRHIADVVVALIATMTDSALLDTEALITHLSLPGREQQMDLKAQAEAAVCCSFLVVAASCAELVGSVVV